LCPSCTLLWRKAIEITFLSFAVVVAAKDKTTQHYAVTTPHATLPPEMRVKADLF